jgi:hypothetical protein
VTLAEKRLKAEAAARDYLNETYRRFKTEGDAAQKNAVGKELIRAIFGGAAIIAEDVIP